MAKQEQELSAEEMKELQETSAKVEGIKKEEAAKIKSQHEENTKGTYTKEQVDEHIRLALAAFKKEESGENNLDEFDPYAQKTLTIPRFPGKDGKWKFVVGFANTNTDEYYKDKVIQAFDIWDDMQKKNVAYVKAIFEDGEEGNFPLNTLIKKSKKVSVDIVETKKIDTSYSAGRTQIATVDGYQTKLEGTVPMKVSRFDYSFVVRLADGREIPIGAEVVNWAMVA